MYSHSRDRIVLLTSTVGMHADATGIPVSASARVSGRWGGSYASHPSCRATSASSNSSSHTAAAAFLAGGRTLAAQVSFNHEKRRGWERPVLEDINARRASAGMPAVDKLTIQVSQVTACVANTTSLLLP
jgi:hypothetical protein